MQWGLIVTKKNATDFFPDTKCNPSEKGFFVLPLMPVLETQCSLDKERNLQHPYNTGTFSYNFQSHGYFSAQVGQKTEQIKETILDDVGWKGHK